MQKVTHFLFFFSFNFSHTSRNGEITCAVCICSECVVFICVASLLSTMSLNDNKAGMQGLDKERINQIIYEASKGQ